MIKMQSSANQGSDQGTTVVQEDPKPMPNLLQELIVDILTRVPVKSLLKFRCVSKSWRSLISTPYFIKSHLKKSTKSNTTTYANHSLLLIPIGYPVKMYTCSLHSILYEKKSPVNALELPMRSLYPQISLLGSCNGIFCILEGFNVLVLWNPALRKWKNLPNSGTEFRRYRIFTYGFGYDELNDDYKVVEICCFCRRGINLETIVNVYSLRANSWRRIRDYEGGIISCSSGVFANGTLHWLVMFKEGSNISWSILSLNIATETYGEIMQANYENGDFDLTLGVLEGCLCVFCNYHEVRMDLWMMNEYGKKESWIKLASIPYVVGSRGRVSPLFVSNSGEILMYDNRCLTLYSGRDDKFTNCMAKMVGPSIHGTASVFIESLVSPHLADDDQVVDQN